jgi:hypothetical protein
MKRMTPLLILLAAGSAPSTVPPTAGSCVALIYPTGSMPTGWAPCTPGMTASDGTTIVGASGGWSRHPWKGFTITDATPTAGAASVVPCKGMWCEQAVKNVLTARMAP